MRIYLVGGAVRDQLLGLPVKEKDWVVVGATPQELLDLGYKPIGKDFPVFLHPKTHEEYALARTERKIGIGYKGFHFYTDPSVTLEEDLKRRDLTINAIAQTPEGKIIDPYHGREDLKNKILRHVSPAFAEDPVRVLRIARFAARFGNFKIHPETLILMRQIVANGEINALVPERVWQELQRTLGLPFPARFFIVLEECKALPILFPEIKSNLGTHMQILEKAVNSTTKETIRFAAMLGSLASTEIKSLCQRVRAPSAYRDLALMTSDLRHNCSFTNFSAEELVTLLERLDAYRRPERFTDLLVAGKTFCNSIQYLKNAYSLTCAITANQLKDLKGTEIKQALHALRVEAAGR